jgi:hypothetical protein
VVLLFSASFRPLPDYSEKRSEKADLHGSTVQNRKFLLLRDALRVRQEAAACSRFRTHIERDESL